MELVAVVANPVYHQVAYTQAFDRQEHLTQVPNWLYLTGSVPQLQQVWKDYGIAAQILPAGSMIGHPDIAYVIDQAGQVRAELNTDPGPGTTATKSSFAVLLADAARQRAEVRHEPPRPPDLPAAGRSAPGRRLRQRGRPGHRPGPPRQTAVPGHLAGHRHRDMGGRRDGRFGRQPQQLLAAVRPPRRHQHLAAGDPARGGQQRRPGPHRPAGAGSVLAGFRPSQDLAYSPLATTNDNGTAWTPAPARCRAGRCPRRPGR